MSIPNHSSNIFYNIHSNSNTNSNHPYELQSTKVSQIRMKDQISSVEAMNMMKMQAIDRDERVFSTSYSNASNYVQKIQDCILPSELNTSMSTKVLPISRYSEDSIHMNHMPVLNNLNKNMMVASFIPQSGGAMTNNTIETNGAFFPFNSNQIVNYNNIMYMQNTSKKDSLRKGKWTHEEELFTNKIIEAFNHGLLELPSSASGITLRSYLSEKLGCDPMRITKKYTGASCLGKRVYHREIANTTPKEVQNVQKELEYLEKKFKDKLEQIRLEKKEHESAIEGIYNHISVSTPNIDAMMLNKLPMQLGIHKPNNDTIYTQENSNIFNNAKSVEGIRMEYQRNNTHDDENLYPTSLPVFNPKFYNPSLSNASKSNTSEQDVTTDEDRNDDEQKLTASNSSSHDSLKSMKSSHNDISGVDDQVVASSLLVLFDHIKQSSSHHDLVSFCHEAQKKSSTQLAITANESEKKHEMNPPTSTISKVKKSSLLYKGKSKSSNSLSTMDDNSIAYDLATFKSKFAQMKKNIESNTDKLFDNYYDEGINSNTFVEDFHSNKKICKSNSKSSLATMTNVC